MAILLIFVGLCWDNKQSQSLSGLQQEKRKQVFPHLDYMMVVDWLQPLSGHFILCVIYTINSFLFLITDED